MKKIFFAAGIAAAFFITSCNDSGTSSAKQKNLDASHAINRAFETGDVSPIDSFISDDFIDHTERGDFKGRDSIKAMVKFLHDNMKDMKTEILREMADDEYVMSWMHWTGTSNGVGGMPNGPYDMHAIEVAKFKDGKAVEHWTYMDMKEMMAMMGGQQQHMSSDMKVDSVVKADTVKAK